MKKTIVAALPILLILAALSGCMSANQLEAERAYYQAVASMQKQNAAQPLVEFVPVDTGKPIIFENVARFTVYAPPPSAAAGPLLQYVQKDYAAPWLNLVGTVASVGIPWWGAATIVKSVGNIAGAGQTTYNQNISGTGNTGTVRTAGNTSLTGGVTGDGNLVGGLIDQTGTPTVVTQPAPVVVTQPAPVIVEPTVVTPAIVNPVIVPAAP